MPTCLITIFESFYVHSIPQHFSNEEFNDLLVCNGVKHRRVLGTLCLRRMGWYPTERDIEYLIGLWGLTVVRHDIGKISKVLDLGHECLD
uniref:Uncharacterized protein n=1 Tax=Hyaloperonospora arabidopsidis (strain Emoy2) TaxID=559515 RepID=M4BS95_HYAAE